jgi:uncharacterized protein YegP (UPF0339 family)
MAKFEVYQNKKSNEYRFRMKASNGQNYKSASGRNNGVKSVMKNATKAAVTEL